MLQVYIIDLKTAEAHRVVLTVQMKASMATVLSFKVEDFQQLLINQGLNEVGEHDHVRGKYGTFKSCR